MKPKRTSGFDGTVQVLQREKKKKKTYMIQLGDMYLRYGSKILYTYYPPHLSAFPPPGKRGGKAATNRRLVYQSGEFLDIIIGEKKKNAIELLILFHAVPEIACCCCYCCCCWSDESCGMGGEEEEAAGF